ncbi:hypothetical protein IR083_20890 [Dysgonomonas sp. GY75]|uniref:hypothetical protein n=1 Tax=Dysgonomonas sp. GY75 TaxID=2780419 RepID=UPI0018847567|nr:hypothetical protein [Dysgonomonas sp. GY75]MBF0651279.1 hypothetical protein [Dysgonomonas sp. GY75]
MEYADDIKTQLQTAVNLLCKAKKFEEEYMGIAQRLGLQGEKRRMRYESACNHNFINFLKCDAYDVYGITLTSEPQNNGIPGAANMKAFFETYLAKMEDQYDTLHTIANKLVTLNCQHTASHLYCKCKCLIEDIKYYRRIILEGNAVSWRPEFILLHQTTECNIHDRFEEKEKEVGYDY